MKKKSNKKEKHNGGARGARGKVCVPETSCEAP